MQWDVLSTKAILKTVPFTVEEMHFRSRKTQEDMPPYYRLDTPDWVNIFAVTRERQAILIRQSRAGSLGVELETPGGMIDFHEKDATMAAARELEEETGYYTQRIMPLGAINPNPAIMNNRLHMFVALDCVLNPARAHFPDTHEDISIELRPLDELEQMIRHGEINSCLCALSIMLGLKYVK